MSNVYVFISLHRTHPRVAAPGPRGVAANDGYQNDRSSPLGNFFYYGFVVC